MVYYGWLRQVPIFVIFHTHGPPPPLYFNTMGEGVNGYGILTDIGTCLNHLKYPVTHNLISYRDYRQSLLPHIHSPLGGIVHASYIYQSYWIHTIESSPVFQVVWPLPWQCMATGADRHDSRDSKKENSASERADFLTQWKRSGGIQIRSESWLTSIQHSDLHWGST